MELWEVDEPLTPLERWQLREMVMEALAVVRALVASVSSYCERWQDGTPTIEDRLYDVEQLKRLLSLQDVA